MTLVSGISRSIGISTQLILKSIKIQPASRGMSSIFIYNGNGTEEESRHLLHNALVESVNPASHSIQYISAEEILQGDWMSKAKVICFGGGYDLGFLSALGNEGIRLIREYVHSGGNYLGMCAGAYFACNYIEFDKDGPLEVVGNRDLRFYPGNCIGPVYPGFVYQSKKGAQAVPVTYKNTSTFKAYMNGGGYFHPLTTSSTSSSGNSCYCINSINSNNSSSSKECGRNIDILGIYNSLQDSPAAIVKCEVGHGCAILSGVHLEYQYKDLDMNDLYLKKLMGQFSEADKKRDFVFRDLLSLLGIYLRKPEKSALGYIVPSKC